MLTKDVQEPWFSYINNGQKNVEGRLNKGSFSTIKKNDIIIWINGNKKIKTQVVSLHKHSNFTNMLRFHRLKHTLPGVKTFNDGLKIYHSFYKQKDIKKYGVLAIKLKLLN